MDFSKVCWYCHKPTMEGKDGYYECCDCGATWNEVSRLAPELIVIEKDEGAGGTKYRPSKRRLVGVGKKIRRKQYVINI